MQKIKEYNYYLFDMDGTLVDTTELIYWSFLHTLKLYQAPPIESRELINLAGLPLREQLELFLGKKSDAEFAPIYAAYNDYQKKIADRYLTVFPHVHFTLGKLQARGKKLAVVTSRRRASLDNFLKLTELETYFTVLVTPEITEKHKPDPEPVLKALCLLEAPARESLFVGDSILDMHCARGAGLDMAFVAWSYAPQGLLPLRPTYILQSMRDLIA